MTWWVAGSVVVGSLIQSRSASRAQDAQQNATNAAIGEQRSQYDQTRADFAPWREAGGRALGQLESDINRPPTAQEVMSTPGYQFGQQQGQQAIDRRIAAMGGRVSGGAIKAAARFGTDNATSGYNAAYQRSQDRLNRLASIAGLGQTATGASAAAGANSTNAISGLIGGQGDADAAMRIGQGNIWANTLNQGAAMYSRRQQPWQQQQFGQTWQQQGGPMDQQNYDPYGYPTGGP